MYSQDFSKIHDIHDWTILAVTYHVSHSSDMKNGYKYDKQVMQNELIMWLQLILQQSIFLVFT